MDDLISREETIEAVRELLLEPDSTQYIYSSDAIGAVKSVPSVPAVPLDKLCEWLERNAVGRWNLEYTASEWKDELTKWMEEQDAAD